MTILILVLVVFVLAYWLGYSSGHDVGYSKAWWERTKKIDQLLGFDEPEGKES